MQQRSLCGRNDLAAKPLAFLQQDHSMPAGGGNVRRSQSRGTATDHDHASGTLRGTQRTPFDFTAANRIVNAGDVPASNRTLDAPLFTTDTDKDLILPAVLDLLQ